MQFSDRIIFVSEASENSVLKIEGDEHLHLTKVLRIKPSQEIRISNGKGLFFRAEVQEVKPRVTFVKIFDKENALHPHPKIHLGVALLKGKDLEEVIETCGQLPIASLTPLLTDRTQGASQRDVERLLQRLEAKSIVCSKQAIKPWLTQIRPPQDLKTYINETHWNIAFMEPTVPSEHIEFESIRELSLLCGPEGGWSPAEIEFLKEQERAFSFHLGDTILRAKNAPFYACGKLSALASQLFK